MPFKSKAQARYIHGIASGSIKPGKGGMSKQAAEKFVQDTHGQKTSRLPERATKKCDGGRVKTW